MAQRTLKVMHKGRTLLRAPIETCEAIFPADTGKGPAPSWNILQIELQTVPAALKRPARRKPKTTPTKRRRHA